MSLLWTSLDYWIKQQHPEGWAILVGGLLTALGTLIAVIIAAFLTHRYTLQQKRLAHNTSIRADILKRRIDALENLWSLLSYISFAESETAIVRWREEKKGERKYYVQIGNLRRFILSEVSQTIYKKSAGLHIPKHIRDDFFDYQGSLMGLYMRYQDEPDDALIQIKNPKLINKLRDAYQHLNKVLKTELNHCYQQQTM